MSSEQKRDKAVIHREALDVLSMLYHNANGEEFQTRIAEFDVKMPGWRSTDMKGLPDNIQHGINHARSWDRAIKLLKEAGRL